MSEVREPQPALVLLGIDPGLRVTGYGLILFKQGAITHLAHGAIRTAAGDHTARLLDIHRGINDLLADWRVDEVAVERQFVAVNASSAFAVGEARAVAIVVAAVAGLPVFEYTPAEVKQAVTSYGRSGKDQVQEMVRLQFGFSQRPEPADAADALAIAICHAALRDRPGPETPTRSIGRSGARATRSTQGSV